MTTTALYRLRLARGQSLRQLAADVGLSYQTLHRVEHGGSVRPSTRRQLENFFGLPFEALTESLNANGDAPQDAAARPHATTAKLTPEDSDER